MRTLVRIGLWAALAAAPAGFAAAQPAGAVKSRLTVTVPDKDAELHIEGRAMQTTGKVVRVFDTPPLADPAADYKYAFKVSWRPNNYTVMTREREVRFRAGADVAVDLTQGEGTDKAVIRFVPTPDDIVAKMIEMAKVTKDDVVYEPGCGDGRITVAAVKAGAKRGVGIDLDPERVAEAKETARAAGVADKVEIRRGDALDIKDLSEASLVCLYMGNEFDALIRPILWKQLKVGARVVSHRFTMGDWVPDKSDTVRGEDGDDYELHLWTVTEAVKKRAADGKK